MKTLTPQPGLVLVGAGNIGSHAAPLLARCMAAGRIVVIDPDHYDESNLTSQHILRRHVGLAKAAVSAQLIKAINPELHVQHHVASVEDVPLGVLRADLIVGAVDNREARQQINARAWRAGTPWLDMAVDPENELVRMNLYVPGTNATCMQCAWDEQDYAALTSRYTCDGERQPDTATVTAAPACLGALIAALGCAQSRRVLDGDASMAGRQLMLDARHHRQTLAILTFNPDCRMEHELWNIEDLHELPGELTLGDALTLGWARTADAMSSPDLRLRHESRAFVRRLRCGDCGATSQPMLQLSGRLRPGQQQCQHCGARRQATGLDQDPELAATELAPHCLDKSMAEIGFRAGDVFTLLSGATARHFQLGAFDGQDS